MRRDDAGEEWQWPDPACAGMTPWVVMGGASNTAHHSSPVHKPAFSPPRVCYAAPNALYKLCCPVREVIYIPGALSILKGAVPDQTRGFGHTAPTYVSRFPGSHVPRPGRHLIFRAVA